MNTGEYAEMITTSEGFRARARVAHFSSLGLARNCHMGTISYLLNQFEQLGCDLSRMTELIEDYTGKDFSIDKYGTRPNEYSVGDPSMQYFLRTYFYNLMGLEKGDKVLQSYLEGLKSYIINEKKQIVVAFATEWQDENWDGYYEKFSHSAILEVVNGQLKLRQSVSAEDKYIDQLVQKHGENVFCIRQKVN